MTIARTPAAIDLDAYLAIDDDDCWFPMIFDRAGEGDRAAMDALLASGEVAFTHDKIGAQLRDLVKSRHPSEPWDEAALEAAVAAHLAGEALRDYGRWVYYRWSRRLVHVLPAAAYAEVRSDRNRLKITPDEQERLGRLRVGLCGLSVGNAVAVTLALEGLFGELRLADFDALDLSNMNRLRCTVDQIGLAKVVITARQILEMNPYASLTLFPEGINRDNIGAFFDDRGRLDVVIDECDSLPIKLRLREEARARGVPVLMETSDRGMLDVERFDVERERPLLHGLVGALSADAVETLSPQARVCLVAAVIGEGTMSPRLAASLLEYGRTLRGFSQLGSDVTLGGATIATAVRRLGLGQPLPSGRVFVDLGSLLSAIEVPPVSGGAVDRGAGERAFVREVVEAAILAPSAGNLQPWRFVWESGVLSVWRDDARSRGAGEREQALVAIGAALENLALAAAAAGREATIEPMPTAPSAPSPIARIRFASASEPPDDPLRRAIAQRRTCRRATTRTPLDGGHSEALREAAIQRGASLHWVDEPSVIRELGALCGEADRIEHLAPGLWEPLAARMRWTADEVQRTRDGIDVSNQGGADELFCRLMARPGVAASLHAVQGGSFLVEQAIASFAAAAAIGSLSVAGSSPSSWVRLGRALQRLWLQATALGLALQPWGSPIRLFALFDREHAVGLDVEDIARIFDLRGRFARILPALAGEGPADAMVIFRLVYADCDDAPSLRRAVEDVLTFAD